MQRLTCVVSWVSVSWSLGVAVPAAAQTFAADRDLRRLPVRELFRRREGESLPEGWYFDVAGNLNPMIGVVFQVGGNYKTFEESVTIGGGTFTATADLKVHEFLGGLRLNARGNLAARALRTGACSVGSTARSN